MQNQIVICANVQQHLSFSSMHDRAAQGPGFIIPLFTIY